MSSTNIKHLAIYSTLGLLAACGGGGGDGGGSTPPPPQQPSGLSLDSSNQKAAASAGAQAALAGSMAVNSATGNPSGTQQVASTEGALALSATTTALRKTIQATTSDATQTNACASGGTQVFRWSDTNDSSTIDAGDTITLIYSQCVVDGQLTDGQIVLAIQQMQSNSAVLNATYTNYVTGSEAGATRLNGTVNLTTNGSLVSGAPNPDVCNASTNTATFDQITSEQLASNGTVIRTTTLKAGHINSTIGVDCSRALNVSETANGTWTGLSGTLTINTPTSILSGPDGIPYAGSYTVAADRGKVQIGFNNGGNVILQLDANGDGTYETSTNLSWADLGIQ